MNDTLQDHTLAFIGAGVMGEAMIGGLVGQHLVAPEAIVASDHRAARLGKRGRTPLFYPAGLVRSLAKRSMPSTTTHAASSKRAIPSKSSSVWPSR